MDSEARALAMKRGVFGVAGEEDMVDEISCD